MELSFSDREWGVGRACFSFQDTEPEAFISVHVYPKSLAPLPGPTSFLRDSRVFSEEVQQTHKSIALCVFGLYINPCYLLRASPLGLKEMRRF